MLSHFNFLSPLIVSEAFSWLGSGCTQNQTDFCDHAQNNVAQERQALFFQPNSVLCTWTCSLGHWRKIRNVLGTSESQKEMMGTCNHCWCTKKGDRGAPFCGHISPSQFGMIRTRRLLFGESLSWLAVFFQFLLTVIHYSLIGGWSYLYTLVDEEEQGREERKCESGLLN